MDTRSLAPQAERTSDEPVPPRGYEFDRAQLKAAAALAVSTALAAVVADRSVGAADSPSAPDISTSFQGIGPTTSFPPDPIFAAGPSHLIQMVNRSFRITDKSGTTLFESTFGDWWANVTGTSGSLAPFDPKVVYDDFSGRWVMLTVNRDNTNSMSDYLLSVSLSSAATGDWCNFALRSDQNGSTDSGAWADYPQLGFDDTNLYITSNQFSFSTGSFTTAKLRIMAKSQFYDNSGLPTCKGIGWYDYWSMLDAPFTLQPARTYGTPGVEYIVNSSSGSGSTLSVRTVSGTWPNGGNTAPTLSTATAVSVSAYTAPVDAPSSGSSTAIDTGDARLLNAVYRNGFLYATSTVGTPCFGATGSSSCVHYYRLSVGGTPSVSLDVSFGTDNLFYFYPAVMPDADGNIFLVFARTGASQFVEARYTVRLTTDSATQGSAQLHAGEAAYTKIDSIGRNRWGDYSGIALDPSDGAVWVYHQYASTPASTWKTWVGRLTAPPTSFTLTITRAGAGVGTVTTNPAGINCGSTCAAAFSANSGVTLIGTAASGSTFGRWAGDSDCTDGSVTMSTNRSCTARFSVNFSDTPITAAVTIVKAQHITDLRSRINSLRASCGGLDYAFSESLTAQSTPIRASHVTELRTALSSTYSLCGFTPPAYTDTLTPQSTVIRAVHLNELRSLLIAIE